MVNALLCLLRRIDAIRVARSEDPTIRVDDERFAVDLAPEPPSHHVLTGLFRAFAT
jgi:hypothetical protein